ncbi:Hypothetical protein BQ3484_236 [Cedratvirus A11]|uniref:F-box domain n=1 Tax=Cedratvirus A11 TaxID=1903266 RepID=A0A1M7XUD2_9VIRU|nr:Hypothetical protein BQ3484_236 [Cedratvirus A11]SHO33304.1 Hypothetical protein BQ3484_236 [Cedratvirus A11]
MQRLFLSMTDPEELTNSCYASEYGREICSDAEFWEEKFTREGLLLLEEGSDIDSWLEIYRKSQDVAQKTNEKMDRSRVSIGLAEVEDPDVLSPLSKSAFLVPFWKNRNGHRYRLDFTPSYTAGIHLYSLVDLPQQEQTFMGRTVLRTRYLEPILKGTVVR